jgi:hypothetical protein
MPFVDFDDDASVRGQRGDSVAAVDAIFMRIEIDLETVQQIDAEAPDLFLASWMIVKLLRSGFRDDEPKQQAWYRASGLDRLS